MKSIMVICLIFGSLMVVTGAQAQERVEGVYCRFDVNKWEGSLVNWLKHGSRCKVEVTSRWGAFDYNQPVIPDFDPHKLWGGSD